MKQRIKLPTSEILKNFDQHTKKDPALLMAYRGHAQQVYAACKQPTKKNDDWKFLRTFDFDAAQLAIQAERPPLIELVGGAILADIRYFFHRYPDKVRKILEYDANGSWRNNKAAALVEGYFTKGTVLYVPRDVQLIAPLTLHLDTMDNSLLLEKVLIIVERGSSITIEDDFCSPSNSLYMRSVAVVAQDYANIAWHYQDQRSYGNALTHYRFYLDRHAHFQGNGCWTNNRFDQQWLEWNLAGERAHVHMQGAYVLREEQTFGLHTLQHHKAPHTLSRVNIKGVVADESQSVFQGMIRIDEDAEKSDADLNNKNLLIHKTSQAISEPQIEVLTDDVACAHGSAVGQLNEEDLFYIRSRGIDTAKAKKILLKAFLLDIVDGMHDQIIGAVEQVI